MKKWIIALGLLVLIASLIIALRPEQEKKETQKIAVEKIVYCGKEYSAQEWKEIGGSKYLWEKKCPPTK